MYLPDLTALLSAANSYGLAASFPAFAAVSAAAAAEFNARQVGVCRLNELGEFSNYANSRWQVQINHRH